MRGGRVLRVTASVGVNRTGNLRLTVQDKWPNTCFMGYVDLPMTANQTITTTVDLYDSFMSQIFHRSTNSLS